MQRRLYRNKSKTDSTKTQISLAKKSQLSIDKEKEDLEFEKKIVITQRNLAAKKINGKLMVVDVFDSDDEKEGKKKAVLSSSSPPEKSVMYEGSINRWAPKAKGDIIPTAITKTMVISKTGVTHKVDDESNFTTENETFKCCEEGCKDEKFDTLEEAKTHYSTKHLGKYFM